MAIPLYVPEEYGPLPANNATTHQQLRQQCPSDEQIRNCMSPKSFLQQLIVDLCSLHQEYCAGNVSMSAASTSVVSPFTAANGYNVTNTTTTTITTSSSNVPVSDFNNNDLQNPTSQQNQHEPVSTRRRRHPAGKNGFPDLAATNLHDFMIPLTTGDIDNVSHPKSIADDPFTNLGFQLRQIADSYAASMNHEPAPKSLHTTHESMTQVQQRSRITRLTISSLCAVATVTAAAAAAAAIMFIRHK